MDLSRPAYLDEIACDFPDLTIVSGLGGWPWVDELVAVARRHPSVFIDLSCVRPRSMERPGSGYDVLLASANRDLQDQLIFASGWSTQSVPLKTLSNARWDSRFVSSHPESRRRAQTDYLPVRS